MPKGERFYGGNKRRQDPPDPGLAEIQERVRQQEERGRAANAARAAQMKAAARPSAVPVAALGEHDPGLKAILARVKQQEERGRAANEERAAAVPEKPKKTTKQAAGKNAVKRAGAKKGSKGTSAGSDTTPSAGD